MRAKEGVSHIVLIISFFSTMALLFILSMVLWETIYRILDKVMV